MTKKEMKQLAQKMLIQFGQTAFYAIWEHSCCDELKDSEREQISALMSKEFARIEKLFGYEPFSWARS